MMGVIKDHWDSSLEKIENCFENRSNDIRKITDLETKYYEKAKKFGAGNTITKLDTKLQKFSQNLEQSMTISEKISKTIYDEIDTFQNVTKPELKNYIATLEGHLADYKNQKAKLKKNKLTTVFDKKYLSTKRCVNKLKTLLAKVKLANKDAKKNSIKELNIATEKTIKNLIYREKGGKHDGMLGSLFEALQATKKNESDKLLKSKANRGFLKSMTTLEHVAKDSDYSDTNQNLQDFLDGIIDCKNDLKQKTTDAIKAVENRAQNIKNMAENLNNKSFSEDKVEKSILEKLGKQIADDDAIKIKKSLDDRVEYWTNYLKKSSPNGISNKAIKSLVALISINAYGSNLSHFVAYMNSTSYEILQDLCIGIAVSAFVSFVLFIVFFLIPVVAFLCLALLGFILTAAFPPVSVFATIALGSLAVSGGFALLMFFLESGLPLIFGAINRKLRSPLTTERIIFEDL